MSESKFIVETGEFNGPLDLLLSLIEKRKLLINDIALAKITDSYIEHVNQIPEISIKENAHFILVASTLLLIKSKSLLPNLNLTEEESESIDDLEKRLKIYKRIKDAEIHITESFEKRQAFYKLPTNSDEVLFSPPEKFGLENIKESIVGILKSLPKKEDLPKTVVKKIVSLEETIINLTEKIQSSLNMSFKDFANVKKSDKVNVVVSFLAMLELVKQGIIEVKQDRSFADIEMQTKVFETPNYS